MTAEPPTWGAERDGHTFRQRIKAWNQQVTGDMNALPYAAYVSCVFKLALYWWLFLRYLMNPAAPLLAGQPLATKPSSCQVICFRLCVHSTSAPGASVQPRL